MQTIAIAKLEGNNFKGIKREESNIAIAILEKIYDLLHHRLCDT